MYSIKSPEEFTEYFFRHEASKLRAAMTRTLGYAYLDFCEDVIQEALYRALSKWSLTGVPENPSGWIFRTAHNIAIDMIRKDKLSTDKQKDVSSYLKLLIDDKEGVPNQEEIQDDLLRMIFTCSSPSLSESTQIVMTLKLLCSFHNKEIANALFKKNSAVEKTVSRGKQKLRSLLNEEAQMTDFYLGSRLDNVLHTIYLLFNEGYKASNGDQLLKESVCLESIRLARLLVANSKTNVPRARALLALLLFTAARFPSRVSSDGSIILLQYQDRSIWDQSLIFEAQEYLNQSAEENQLSKYHLMAGIAACHAYAKDFKSTDWNLIIEHYDMLLSMDPSFVYQLNRIVALLHAKQLEVAIKSFRELEPKPEMDSYYLYYMVKAEIAWYEKKGSESVDNLEQAKALTTNEVEKDFIDKLIGKRSK